MPSELGSKWPAWIDEVDVTQNSDMPWVKHAVGWSEIEAVYSQCRQVFLPAQSVTFLLLPDPGCGLDLLTTVHVIYVRVEIPIISYIKRSESERIFITLLSFRSGS